MTVNLRCFRHTSIESVKPRKVTIIDKTDRYRLILIQKIPVSSIQKVHFSVTINNYWKRRKSALFSQNPEYSKRSDCARIVTFHGFVNKLLNCARIVTFHGFVNKCVNSVSTALVFKKAIPSEMTRKRSLLHNRSRLIAQPEPTNDKTVNNDKTVHNCS